MSISEALIRFFGSDGSSGRKYYPWLRTAIDEMEPAYRTETYYRITGDKIQGRVRITCTTEMVLVLSQIIYWNLPSAEGMSRLRVERDGEVWLAKSSREWASECGIPFQAAKDAVKRLELLGLIRLSIRHFRGHPTKHIILNVEALLEIARTSLRAHPELRK